MLKSRTGAGVKSSVCDCGGGDDTDVTDTGTLRWDGTLMDWLCCARADGTLGTPLTTVVTPLLAGITLPVLPPRPDITTLGAGVMPGGDTGTLNGVATEDTTRTPLTTLPCDGDGDGTDTNVGLPGDTGVRGTGWLTTPCTTVGV